MAPLPHNNVILLMVELDGTFQRCTRHNGAKVPDAIKDWTVIADIKATKCFGEEVDIVGCHAPV